MSGVAVGSGPFAKGVDSAPQDSTERVGEGFAPTALGQGEERSSVRADGRDRPIVKTVAIVGNPNCGKTTIFNALTGLRQKVGNYPGVTVERRVGDVKGVQPIMRLVDLPGTYSLVGLSPDERVVGEELRGVGAAEHAPGDRPSAIIAVVDASNLPRNLYVVSQLLELRLPMVVALNMADVARRRGQRVDAQELARLLGCAVITVVGHRRLGIQELRAALGRAQVPLEPSFELPRAMQDEVDRLAICIGEASQAPAQASTAGAHSLARRLLIEDEAADLTHLAQRPAVRERLGDAREALAGTGVDPVQADVEGRYAWIDRIVAQAVSHVTPEAGAQPTWTDRADGLLMHRVGGLLVFAAVMSALFMAVFWLAKPLSTGIQSGIDGLSELAQSWLTPGPVRDLLTDGALTGVGTVLVFVPQVAVLFLLLAILEDSGYLARAAFLMDRALASVGLHGKSFIPLLSSFGCAIPGVLAARTIDDRRARLATILVAPFMSCSARLPVYTLLIAVCFAGSSPVRQASILLALYGLGILAAAGTALALRGRLRGSDRGTFILELPTYKLPQPSQVLFQAWTHTWAFVARAGTTILAMSVILWALLYYPRLPAERAQGLSGAALRGAQVEYSVGGRFGHSMEPALRPLGFDWKIGVGLLGAFAAREVFVSTIGIAYRVEQAGESSDGLVQAMLSDRYPDNRPVWTPLVGVSLMLWFVLAMQCMSTLAVVRRETGGWRWPVAQVVLLNTLAYTVCYLVYTVGGRFAGF